MNYQIGSVHPLDYQRPPMGDHCGETWYILTNPPMKEKAASAYLSRVGFSEVWLPTETAWRPSRGPRLREKYERLIVPGYIFAMTTQEPVFDVLFERARGRVSGVVSVGNIPYKVKSADFEAMRKVPERIRIEREKAINEKRIYPGDRARLNVGPLAGYTVDIETVDRGIAYFIMGSIKGSAPVEGLEK